MVSLVAALISRTDGHVLCSCRQSNHLQMTAAVVIAGTTVLSVAIVVCSVILLVSDQLVVLGFSLKSNYF